MYAESQILVRRSLNLSLFTLVALVYAQFCIGIDVGEEFWQAKKLGCQLADVGLVGC